jgi:hypothetical protein
MPVVMVAAQPHPLLQTSTKSMGFTTLVLCMVPARQMVRAAPTTLVHCVRSALQALLLDIAMAKHVERVLKDCNGAGLLYSTFSAFSL